ncbi:hypothetical protein GLAREA_04652 [Glarea lozoyensis ATCC 20868]|uniref:Acyl-CoA N-acyltransferases (Nat) n=1 Tax=Glarea lozoyensis (strain ATCC 20868 / MF5171) TaxID=1116229 RepID=S3D782_GLAL2|nr:uncharacterized protein GLAREA_04652 [Glarea lozoyensis ATCC 20868]EPE27861.1 hypothetical protein GLAREA_04652 [Glarea lozoyensis ATCC 20868]
MTSIIGHSPEIAAARKRRRALVSRTYSKRVNSTEQRPPAKRSRISSASQTRTVANTSHSLDDAETHIPEIRDTHRSPNQSGRDENTGTWLREPPAQSLPEPSFELPPLVRQSRSRGRQCTLKDGIEETSIDSQIAAGSSPELTSQGVLTSCLDTSKCNQLPPTPKPRPSSQKRQATALTSHSQINIKNYFKPLSRSLSSSSKILTESCKTTESENYTPPSSPPVDKQELENEQLSESSQCRPRRRLITKTGLHTYLNAHSSEVSGGLAAPTSQTTGYVASSDLSAERQAILDVKRISSVSNEGRSGPSIVQCAASSPVDAIASQQAVNPRRKNAKKLQQTHLDLGQTSEIVCKNCQMVYNSAVEADRRDHEIFCASHGCPLLSKEEARRKNEFVWERMVQAAHHRIRMITCSSSQASKETAVSIMEHVYNELPGLCYSPEELWGGGVRKSQNRPISVLVGPFKVFIYYVGVEVAGVILAESYKEGMLVQTEGLPTGQKKVVLDRIWVREKHRRNGIASILADLVRQKFICGIEIDKSGVSTSNLTRSFGVPWAKRYFGE